MKQSERYQGVIEYFKKHKPDAATELEYHDPFQLIISVILSAQCTDKRVNMVTPELFRAFPTVRKLAEGEADEVFPYIRSISYPNSKAKHLVGMAKMLLHDFNGKVPEKIEELLKLPGVGRKTANVIASVVYQQPAMAVDTHVFRVSSRIGLTLNAKNPLQAEQQLVKHIPKAYIPLAHHWLILHGRYICVARNPKCQECGIREFCKYYAEKVKP